jgi:RNA polymerase sigma-70 factor (ECF subfamily)
MITQEEAPLLTEAELVEIYREHTGPLYVFVSRRVGADRSLAEDIVQDAWLRAVDHWPRRGTPDHPRAWLMRVARNLLISHFRRRRPTLVDPSELELEADTYSPETPAVAALVNWGLARMRRGQAALLESFYFDGKGTREIAEELGLSERAVEGRLRRARQNLEKRLKPYVGTDSTGRIATEPTVEPVAALELSEGGKKNA